MSCSVCQPSETGFQPCPVCCREGQHNIYHLIHIGVSVDVDEAPTWCERLSNWKYDVSEWWRRRAHKVRRIFMSKAQKEAETRMIMAVLEGVESRDVW